MSAGQSRTSAGQPRTSTSTIYPIGCLQCDHRPTVPLDSTCEIRAILNGKNNLIPGLAVLGIVSDHHMRLFRRWGTTLFFNSISLHILPALHRIALIKCLFQQRGLHQSEDDPLMPVHIFQQPSPALERHLINGPASVLREAMGLKNDIQSFEHVVVCLFFQSEIVFTKLQSRIQ
jgi:hypothetical protein